MSLDPKNRQLRLAAVVGLARFLEAHGKDQPELAGLRQAMLSVGAGAASAIRSGDPRAVADFDMALSLGRLLARDGLSDEQRTELDANAGRMLTALLEAAQKVKPTTGGALQA